MDNRPAARPWQELAAALASGILFGLGLVVSGMANPAKVLAFLDVTGEWDPTLLVVMCAALVVTAPAFARILKRPGPLFTTRFSLPTVVRVERGLVAGAVLFGIGWGLVGLCPGPALTDLVTGHISIVLFVAAMAAGMMTAGFMRGHGMQDASGRSYR